MSYNVTTYHALGLFSRPDPKAADYPGLNPYLFCAANPIIYTDPTGEACQVGISPDSIVISANVYTSESSFKSASIAASFWNDLSGKYRIGDQVISFKINVIIVNKEDTVLKDMENVKEEDEEDIVSAAANFDPEGLGNTFLVIDEFNNMNVNGRAKGTEVMRVRKSREFNKETGAHEMGHMLGLGHYLTGLMTEESSSPFRCRDVGTEEIYDIIKGALDGNPKTKVKYIDGGSVPNEFKVKKNKRK